MSHTYCNKMMIILKLQLQVSQERNLVVHDHEFNYSDMSGLAKAGLTRLVAMPLYTGSHMNMSHFSLRSTCTTVLLGIIVVPAFPCMSRYGVTLTQGIHVSVVLIW